MLAAATWDARAAPPLLGARVSLIELEVKDVIPMPEGGAHAVMLISKDGEAVLPVFVEESEAIAIAFRLAHRMAPQQLSEDLLDRMVEGLGGAVTEVRIDDVQDHVFESRIFVSQGRRKLEFSAKTSDSIAMALSSNSKIFASQKVVDEAGITRAEIEEFQGEHGPGVGGAGPPEELEGLPEAPPDLAPDDGPPEYEL
jgi:bifunctional DNase/RNase